MNIQNGIKATIQLVAIVIALTTIPTAKAFTPADKQTDAGASNLLLHNLKPGAAAFSVIDKVGGSKVDLLDVFMAKDMLNKENGKNLVTFVLSDGSGTMYDCLSGHRRPSGIPADTLVGFEFHPIDKDGKVPVTINRTINFLRQNNLAKYDFTFDPSKKESFIVDDGAYFSYADGQVSYRQTQGPIGAKGARALEISFDFDHGQNFHGRVVIDSNSWEFGIDKVQRMARINDAVLTAQNDPTEDIIAGVAAERQSMLLSMTTGPVVRVKPPIVTTGSAICPIGYCERGPGTLCRFMGINIPLCICEDDWSCWIR